MSRTSTIDTDLDTEILQALRERLDIETTPTPASPTKIIRIAESARRAGDVDESTLWRWEQKGLFPRRVRFGPNCSGHYEHEVEAWLTERRNSSFKIPTRSARRRRRA